MSAPAMSPSPNGVLAHVSALAPEPTSPDWAILTAPLPADTRGSIALGQSVGSAVGALRAN
ncbi:MAG TPA: hypothetical protein VGL23_14425, partial [Chloroflexota bacterium]